MVSINNLSLRDSLFYVFFLCLYVTIIPAFELSAAGKDDRSDKTGTDASYTSDAIEKTVVEVDVEVEEADVIRHKANELSGGKTIEPLPAKDAVGGKIQSTSGAKSEIHAVPIGKGDVIKVGAPGSKKGVRPLNINAPIDASPERLEAVSQEFKKGIKRNPEQTIFISPKKDTAILEVANPDIKLQKKTPQPDQKPGWYKATRTTETGEVKPKDVYHPGSTDADTTDKLKNMVKETGSKKAAANINKQTLTKKHVAPTPTAKEKPSGGKISDQTPTKTFDKKELSGGKVTDPVDTKISVSSEAGGDSIGLTKADGGKSNRTAAGEMPQTKQQKISSDVPGSGGQKTKVYGDAVPSTGKLSSDVPGSGGPGKLSLDVPGSGGPGKLKANTNIPGKKTKVIGGMGDALDVLEIGAKGVNNYAKTKGESIDKGNEDLTGDEILKITRDTMPGVSDYDKAYEASNAFQDKRRLESVRRQERISQLENKGNLTLDEEVELSKLEIQKEYNQEDIAGSLERRKKQKQLSEKILDGSITPEQMEELEQLGNEELAQRARDAKNDAAAAVNNVVEGYEADMMERFNAEKKKAQEEGREFREKPDFYNDALPMAGEMMKDTLHAINPINQIHTSLTEADIEFSTHDERRAWAAMKDKMSTNLNSQANEIDKQTRANTTKLSQLLSEQDLTDPKVQDSINTLLDQMKQDREKLEKLNALADSNLQEVDPEKLTTLRDLDDNLPDIASMEDWSNSLIDKQVEEQKQKFEEDLVELGDDLLDRLNATADSNLDKQVEEHDQEKKFEEDLIDDLRSTEYQADSDNPQQNMNNNTYGSNNVSVTTMFANSTWQPSATDITANERTSSANAADAAEQIKNNAQNQAAAYQAAQTANQNQTAESLNQIERDQSAQMTDAIIGGFTSGIAEGVGTFGERVGQGAGIKASESIYGHDYGHKSGADKHHSDTPATTQNTTPAHPQKVASTNATSKPPSKSLAKPPSKIKTPPKKQTTSKPKPPAKKKTPPKKQTASKPKPNKTECPPGTIYMADYGVCGRTALSE